MFRSALPSCARLGKTMPTPHREDMRPHQTRPPSKPAQPSGTGTNIRTTNEKALAPASSGNTPDMSDDESVDLSPQDHGSPLDSVKSSSQGRGFPEPGGASGGSSTAADTPSMPVQKRRRVTRACDECRRKKIKCDGKQPCTHCSVYSYGNTNIVPPSTARARTPADQYRRMYLR